MLVEDMVTEFGHVKELALALLTRVHYLDTLKELIEVEAAGVVVSLCTLQLP